MRFADTQTPRLTRPRAFLVLLVAGIFSLAATSPLFAAGAKRQQIGAVTSVQQRTVAVQGTRVKPHGRPGDSKPLVPLYAGDTIKATAQGRVWFYVKVDHKQMYCYTVVDGGTPGALQVAPDPKHPDVLANLQSGEMLCATNSNGGTKTITADVGGTQVTVKTLDPVFQIVALKRKVTIALKRGSATIFGAHAGKGKVVGNDSAAGNGVAKVVTIAPGGDPSQPQTQSLGGATNTNLGQLAAKAPPPPPPPPNPPKTMLAVFPPAVNGQSPFAFEFKSIPTVVSTLFSCSLNGGLYYACSSGNPL